jgi:spore coat-associated protein N
VGRRMKLRRRGALWAGFGRVGRAGTALDRRAWRTAGEPATPAGVLGGATLAAPPPENTGGSRRRTLATLVLGLIAVATAVGSGADFTARTANPSNTFSAGSLSMENSKDGTAILNAANMKPGEAPKTGIVDIKNTGSVDGAFTLSRDQLGSTDASNDNPAPFASKVAIGVVDCGEFTTVNGPYGPVDVTPTCGDGDDSTLYLGSLANQNSPLALGRYAPGEKHRYDFEASLDGSAGNEYEGDSASARYVFDATQTP